MSHPPLPTRNPRPVLAVRRLDGTWIWTTGLSPQRDGPLHLQVQALPPYAGAHLATLASVGEPAWDSLNGFADFREARLYLPAQQTIQHAPLNGARPVASIGNWWRWDLIRPSDANLVHNQRSVTAGRHQLEGAQTLAWVVGVPSALQERPLNPNPPGLRETLGRERHSNYPTRYSAAESTLACLTGEAASLSGNQSRPDFAAWCLAHEAVMSWSGISRQTGPYKYGGVPHFEARQASGNGAYWTTLWTLENALFRSDPNAYQLALLHGRHIAGQGFIHSPGSRWHGYRRFEKASGDFAGDARRPTSGHNFGSDLQLLAAVSEDPLISRAADSLREAALTHNNRWNRIYGSRKTDRLLENLLVAWQLTGDRRYADHAEAEIDITFGNLHPGERWFANEAITTGAHVSAWMDGGLLWRLCQWHDVGRGRRHEARLLDLLEYAGDHYLRRAGAGFEGAHMHDPSSGATTYNRQSVAWQLRPLEWLSRRPAYAHFRTLVKEATRAFWDRDPSRIDFFQGSVIAPKERGRELQTARPDFLHAVEAL